MQFPAAPTAIPSHTQNQQPAAALREVKRPLDLESGTWHRSGQSVTVCINLPKGVSVLELS